ncbi:MAG: hypothetical protein Q7S61_00795 [bacterium]|nr:hypothetical protein [bacterium]
MTLTELSYDVRKMAPFAVLFVLIILIFFYAIKLLFVYVDTQKVPVTHLDPIFNKINTPVVKDATSSAGIHFTLDTIEGQPVTATESAYVYFLPSATANFGFREKIYLMAKTLGFDTEVVRNTLDGTTAEFNDGIQKLTIDITNFNYTYDYDIRKEATPAAFIRPSSAEDAQSKATDFLRRVERYPEELSRGKTNLIYLWYDQASGTMSVVDSIENANMVEVDFYRPDIISYPIVSSQYFNSQNYVVLGYTENGFKIVRAQVHFYEKSEDRVGTYPVKTGDQAWQDLIAGNGIIISKEGVQDVVIKKMFFAYLDQGEYQQYLEPVYVFLGENNFVAYVPGITSTYLIPE